MAGSQSTLLRRTTKGSTSLNQGTKEGVPQLRAVMSKKSRNFEARISELQRRSLQRLAAARSKGSSLAHAGRPVQLFETVTGATTQPPRTAGLERDPALVLNQRNPDLVTLDPPRDDMGQTSKSFASHKPTLAALPGGLISIQNQAGRPLRNAHCQHPMLRTWLNLGTEERTRSQLGGYQESESMASVVTSGIAEATYSEVSVLRQKSLTQLVSSALK